MSNEHPENDWLSVRLTAEAREMAVAPCQIPSTVDLRERVLRRREARARWTTYAAGSVMVISMFGWSLRGVSDPVEGGGFVPASPVHSEIPGVRVVGHTGSDEPLFPQPAYQVKARWWEPVPVEWVDASGRSLGFAGFVAEEHSSLIAPESLKEEERTRVLRAVESYPLDGQTF